MFSTAFTIAQAYTHSVIIADRKPNGECAAGIGTFVMINDEGWFVTALHIVQQIQQLTQSNQQYNETIRIRSVIEADTSLKPGEKQKKLKSHVVAANATTDLLIWWNNVSASGAVSVGFALPEVDLAVGKFDDYVKPPNPVYPKFKDPTKPMTPGTSLCKLGYPLHEIKPSFDSKSKTFTFPEGSIPAPLFPLDGILTRTVGVQTPTPSPFPLLFLETSSPGLLGQSGGPTFDVHGAIWAIQSQTRHYPLGFGQNQGNGGRQSEFLRNQYLNVGWGIHSHTITSFLQHHNIAFELSPY